MINIVIPAAGRGSRFSSVTDIPKPFIDIKGKIMIDHAISSLVSNYAGTFQVHVCFHKDHIKYENFLNELKNKYDLQLTYIDYVTSGQAETVNILAKKISNNYPILIANCDQIIEWDINNFISYCFLNNLDGCIPVFSSDSDKWSYAQTDENGFVLKTVEKKVISNNATVGVYYWKNKETCIKSIEDMKSNNDMTNNEHYVCPAYNYLIKNGGKVMIWNDIIMHGVGTPDDLKSYIELQG